MQVKKLKNKNKIISIVSNIMFIILIITILISAFLFANNNSKDKSILGYRYYTVLTPSMTPSILEGSVVFVKLMAPSELKEGDIITYSASKDGKIVVTHRIEEIINDEDGLRFITKGDANNSTDLNPVLSSQVIGKVNLSIPYLGNILAYIQKNIWLVVALIIALMIIIEMIFYLVSLRNKLKGE